MAEQIQQSVKDFILREFLPGEDPALLTGSTELITGGILDSLATLRLVAFLEGKFGITVQAHEASVDNLNTLNLIDQFVASKR